MHRLLSNSNKHPVIIRRRSSESEKADRSAWHRSGSASSTADGLAISWRHIPRSVLQHEDFFSYSSDSNEMIGEEATDEMIEQKGDIADAELEEGEVDDERRLNQLATAVRDQDELERDINEQVSNRSPAT